MSSEKRYRVVTPAGNTYFAIGKDYFICSDYSESDYFNAEYRVTLECMSLFINHILENGGSHSMIQEMLVAGDLGRNTSMKQLADRLGEYIENQRKP